MATLVLLCTQVGTVSLSDPQVSNDDQQVRIILSFIGDPEYTASQDGRRTIVLDIEQAGVIRGLLLLFSNNSLVKPIRSGTPGDAQSLRLVVDLIGNGRAEAVKRRNGSNYIIVFTVNADTSPPPPSPPVVAKRVEVSTVTPYPVELARNLFKVENDRATAVTNSNTSTRPVVYVSFSSGDKVVIAIDVGHGGQDPGAIGPGGTREKNVTIVVARRLRNLLNDDPIFRSIFTRDGDYLISVTRRSDVAHEQNTNSLVSIHADTTPNRDVIGTSVWVLSNRRTSSKMAGRLKQHEKQSELLGDAGGMLANGQSNPYLSRTVLDLQFSHLQHVGCDVTISMIGQLERVGSMHKRRPEHASLSILHSPDISSALAEIGLINNNGEERLLTNDDYQQQLAEVIYRGLHNYFQACPTQAGP